MNAWRLRQAQRPFRRMAFPGVRAVGAFTKHCVVRSFGRQKTRTSDDTSALHGLADIYVGQVRSAEKRRPWAPG